MEDWVREAHDLLIEYGFRRSLLSTAVQHAHLAVREGCQEIMDVSARAAVPLLVFSAGIADVLEEVWRQQLPKPLPDTVHVVSNRMVFSSSSSSSASSLPPSSSSSPTDTIEAPNKKDEDGKEEGVLIGFTEPVFHVFNKRAASVLETSPYFHQTDYEQRKNVVLVGDSLGDLHMSDGLEAEEILRVGFLNDR
jgi:5'-nucleotidase